MTIETADLSWLAPACGILAAGAAYLDRTRAWLHASTAVSLGLVAALIGAGAAIWQEAMAGQPADLPGRILAVLVTFLGWVVVRYSRNYLRGEAGQARYVVALLLTLAAVLTVALTDHLGWLVVAWSASSLGLHQLLTFYADRPAARIVAHKKFLASRLAELCLGVALILLYRESGTLDLSSIARHIAELDALPPALHVAAVLIALAALLKSAQLPVHGWLIQVMEAPTPVSALLHAGVVNIAGFVVIRLAALLSAAPAAQALLVIVGGSTALLAGLVMMTRISIKVRLAWSTCAQMGFMLLECGLGLYELAMLHLVAHSLYKAHAFLSSGETVQQVRRQDLAPTAPATTRTRLVTHLALALSACLAIVAGSAYVWSHLHPSVTVPVVALIVLALGLAPLLWDAGGNGNRAAVRTVAGVFALTQIYYLWHLAFQALVPTPAEPPLALAVCAAFFLLALYVLQGWLAAFPQGRLARGLYPWAYAGFYLDERYTRLVFRLWPARMSRPAGPRPATRVLPGERA